MLSFPHLAVWRNYCFVGRLLTPWFPGGKQMWDPEWPFYNDAEGTEVDARCSLFSFHPRKQLKFHIPQSKARNDTADVDHWHNICKQHFSPGEETLQVTVENVTLQYCKEAHMKCLVNEVHEYDRLIVEKANLTSVWLKSYAPKPFCIGEAELQFMFLLLGQTASCGSAGPPAGCSSWPDTDSDS